MDILVLAQTTVGVDFVNFFALGLGPAMLFCNWMWGEQETVTKIVLTCVYLLSWLLLFIGVWAVCLASLIFGLVVAVMTFGIDWLIMNR